MLQKRHEIARLLSCQIERDHNRTYSHDVLTSASYVPCANVDLDMLGNTTTHQQIVYIFFIDSCGLPLLMLLLLFAVIAVADASLVVVL